ncbi:MAG: P1 family peptidase [Proteobacteria bacterium]|nr:P1 family peptidase [Pseudomonadota bacterium]
MLEITLKHGPDDLITDVAGISVGQAEDEDAATGVTVVLPRAPVVMGVDVRGGAPGTRETDALDPTCLVEDFHGLVLAGGSVFGLAAADAVVNWLSEKNIGLKLGPRAIPVVPAAILYDLANGGDKDWGDAPPYGRLARQACENAGKNFSLGPYGAGRGATAGDKRGGIGSASYVTEDGLMVGALVAVNSFGEVNSAIGRTDVIRFPKAGLIGANTSIGLVATNMKLTKAGARRLAIMAHDGLARAIRPLHTPFDGDSIFAMATGTWEGGESAAQQIALAGAMAANCIERAVGKAVNAANHDGPAGS